MEQRKMAVLISCTDHYHNRVYLFDDYLRAQGYETQYLAADFHHIRKENYVCDVEGARQLHVRPYQKNLSLNRILSHRDFARAAYQYLESLPREPELIVADIPPNFLATYLARYKKRHPKVRLVMDLFDLWPETFPSGKVKKLLAPMFALWASLRDRSLPQADRIITECDLFRQKLGLMDDPRSRTVYLAATRVAGMDLTAELPEDHLSLCYLGSINNIIDIPAIAELVEGMVRVKPVTVHVIGKGERLEEFLDALKTAGAAVDYHGVIYDEAEKQAVIARCHFGINIMKSSVCIGLTMKSVDYWCHDLPIINNISADTAALVETHRVGINLGQNTAAAVCGMTTAQNLAMRDNVHRLFDACFDRSVVVDRLASVLGDIL